MKECTIPELILEVLSDGVPRANHEIRQSILERYGRKVDDSTISARERDSLKGKVEGVRKPGKSYKVWTIATMPNPCHGGTPVVFDGNQAVML